MSRRTRQILFWVFFVLFAAIAPLIVLYARGYRFDFERKRFRAVGGFYFRSIPPGAAIYVDGVRRGETAGTIGDAVSKPGLIANILPGEYEVRIEREEYLPWIKLLSVTSRKITEARSVLLLPADQAPQTVFFTPLYEALATPDGTRVVIVTQEAGRERLGVLDLEERKLRVLAERKKSSEDERVFHLVSISPKSDLVFFQERTATTSIGTALMLNEAASDTRFGLPAGFRRTMESGKSLTVFLRDELRDDLDASRIQWSEDGSRLWLLAGDALLHWDIRHQELYEVASLIRAFARAGKDLVAVHGAPPSLKVLSPENGSMEDFAIEPFAQESQRFHISELAESRYLVTAYSPDTAAEGKLYVVARNERPVLIDEGVIGVWPSPDSKKLLIQKAHEVWVYYTEDVLTEPARHAGAKQLVVRLGTDVKEARWHPLSNDHVVYVDARGLFVTELDDRGGMRNTVDVARHGDIRIVSLDKEKVFLLMGGVLNRISWKPEKRIVATPTPPPVYSPEPGVKN